MSTIMYQAGNSRPQYGLSYRHMSSPIHIIHTVDRSMGSLPCHDQTEVWTQCHDMTYQVLHQGFTTNVITNHASYIKAQTTSCPWYGPQLRPSYEPTPRSYNQHRNQTCQRLNMPNHNINTIMANDLNGKTQMSHHTLTCIQSHACNHTITSMSHIYWL